MRGISRNSSSAACQQLISLGAEILSGSVSSKEFLIRAFDGAHTIFATTDFWSTYRDPASVSLVAQGQTLNEYSYETEVQQGKNIAQAASSIANLELFIWSDLVSTREISGGKWTWVFHFDSKAEVERYIKHELPDLSAKTSYFIPGIYVANLEKFWKPTMVKSPKSNCKIMLTNFHSSCLAIRRNISTAAAQIGKYSVLLVGYSPGLGDVCEGAH